MTHDVDDREVLDGTVQDITEAIATVIARSWVVSPRATLLAMSRALGALCLRHVAEHPTDRANVLVMLRSLLDSVDVETGAKH